MRTELPILDDCVVAATWEHFDHDADIGIRGIGPSAASALEQAAIAATAVIADPSRVRTEEAVEIVCDGGDPGLLLAAWINALVHEMACRRMLFGRFEVRLLGNHLEARAWGEKVDIHRHQPAVEIKGATFTELRMEPSPSGGWLAQCVVDV
jgi:SHS2 domain-containing protein